MTNFEDPSFFDLCKKAYEINNEKINNGKLIGKKEKIEKCLFFIKYGVRMAEQQCLPLPFPIPLSNIEKDLLLSFNTSQFISNNSYFMNNLSKSSFYFLRSALENTLVYIYFNYKHNKHRETLSRKLNNIDNYTGEEFKRIFKEFTYNEMIDWIMGKIETPRMSIKRNIFEEEIFRKFDEKTGYKISLDNFMGKINDFVHNRKQIPAHQDNVFDIFLSYFFITCEHVATLLMLSKPIIAFDPDISKKYGPGGPVIYEDLSPTPFQNVINKNKWDILFKICREDEEAISINEGLNS